MKEWTTTGQALGKKYYMAYDMLYYGEID